MINLHLSKKLFNPAYLPYLNDTHKYQVFYGGAGSGKSVFICQKILIKAVNAPRRVLIIRKTQVSQRDSCWKLTIDLLKQWQIYATCKINKSDYQIDLPNGSQLLYKGLDDPEKIKSITGITDTWVEEATELSEDDFLQLVLRQRTMVEDSQFYISFNPISKVNWVYKHWFAPGVEIPDDTIIVKTTYKDNKFLPQSYIDNLERMITVNPTYYKIYALGEFATLDKLVYNHWRISDFNPNDIKGTYIAGLDFGYSNDPTAIIQALVDEENHRIYICREYRQTGLTNPEIAAVIKEMGIAKDVIIADSAEPKSIEEIRRAGIPRIRESVKGADSILQGIQLLQQYEIIVSPECQGIIEELENYSWQKDKSGEYINRPIDLYNHELDALRYAIQSLGKGQLRTIKNIFI